MPSYAFVGTSIYLIKETTLLDWLGDANMGKLNVGEKAEKKIHGKLKFLSAQLMQILGKWELKKGIELSPMLFVVTLWRYSVLKFGGWNTATKIP